MSNCCARVGIIFWEIGVCARVCVYVCARACVDVRPCPHLATYSPRGQGLSVGARWTLLVEQSTSRSPGVTGSGWPRQ